MLLITWKFLKITHWVAFYYANHTYVSQVPERDKRMVAKYMYSLTSIKRPPSIKRPDLFASNRLCLIPLFNGHL